MKRALLLAILTGVVLGVASLAAEPWVEGPALNVARYKCRALVLDGKIYVIGGRDPDKNVAPVEVFDPAVQWVSGRSSAPHPKTRMRCPAWRASRGSSTHWEMPCVASFEGKLYALGGRTSEKVRTKVGYVLDLAGEGSKWTQLPGTATFGHGDAGYGVIGTKVYLVSGEDDSLPNEGWDYVKAVDVFDMSTHNWSSAAPIPFGREDFGPSHPLGAAQGSGDRRPDLPYDRERGRGLLCLPH